MVGELLYTTGRTQEAAVEDVEVTEVVVTVTLPIRAVLDLGLGMTASKATEAVGEVMVAPIGVAAAKAVVTSLCAVGGL